jgi:RNA polymerase sigma factor (TIGR02999 family)
VSNLGGGSDFAAGEITRLLADVREGDRSAHERLFEIVYHELKRIARRQLRGSRPDQTLQPTDLVHEAYLRLARPEPDRAQIDRAHFFAVAASAMRHIVIDHVRARSAVKRGEGRPGIAIDSVQVSSPLKPEAELLALDAGLAELETLDPRLGRVVELRFFGGMTAEEIGEALEVSSRTVRRDWRRARAFLQGRLTGCEGVDGL